MLPKYLSLSLFLSSCSRKRDFDVFVCKGENDFARLPAAAFRMNTSCAKSEWERFFLYGVIRLDECFSSSFKKMMIFFSQKNHQKCKYLQKMFESALRVSEVLFEVSRFKIFTFLTFSDYPTRYIYIRSVKFCFSRIFTFGS